MKTVETTETTNERSYHQYCPLAHTLDIVGDRWALLIIRDLFLGPKRFTDLAHGLPGIGANILTARLKGLEKSGLVRRRVLPPPAASSVYELTNEGRDLEATLSALAQWGARHLGSLAGEVFVSAESVKMALYGLFQRELVPLPSPLPTLYETRINITNLHHWFQVRIWDGTVQVTDGDGDTEASSAITMDAETLYALIGERETWAQAAARGAIVDRQSNSTTV